MPIGRELTGALLVLTGACWALGWLAPALWGVALVLTALSIIAVCVGVLYEVLG